MEKHSKRIHRLLISTTSRLVGEYDSPDIAITHAAFDLTVDLTKHELHGIAKLTVERRNPKAQEIRLDVGSLEIASVAPCDGTDGLAASYKASTLSTLS